MSTNDNKILSHSVWNCKYHIVEKYFMNRIEKK